MEEHKQNISTGLFQKLWQKLCFLFVVSFYRKIEISSADQLENNQPIILCANHSNALADAVLLQYTCKRLIHPLARSGLFKHPFLKIFLSIWQAVPVYRRQDSANGTVDNETMFRKAYDMLAQNEVLMIFPEGQSHSDFHLREIKTGASRLVLGYKEKYNELPLVVPVGLNFTDTIKFRSNVYINYGAPVNINEKYHISNEQDVKSLTREIMESMKNLILEVDEIEDLVLVNQVERFFSLRHKTARQRNLSQKFKSQKLLLAVKNYLYKKVPDQIESFKRHLKQFNRLCNKLGINDYSLTVSYNSRKMMRFSLRSLFILLVILPIGTIGFINSFLPYLMTRLSTRLLARDKDQHDTTKILAGSLFFSVFWAIQTLVIYNYFGINAAIVYFVLLAPTSLTAIAIDREKTQIIDNIRVFMILLNSKNLRRYLLRKRKNIEKELASLIKVARKNKQHRF